MDAIPEFSYHLASIIKSLYGKNKKVLVLDADNTLWHGVIGECGVDGIDMGVETSIGQSFHEWQQYLLRLKNQGVLLAIASKNDLESVKRGLEHPDSLLRMGDFASIKVNWNNKDSNLLSIAEELNIGLNQIVFVDDNPAERDLIRQSLPQVEVVEAEQPDKFMELLQRSCFFEVTKITDEDRHRTELYADNRQRAESQDRYASYQEYLMSMDMVAQIQFFQSVDVKRITQLINRPINLTSQL